MTITLRREASIAREIDGEVKFDDLIEKLKITSVGTFAMWILWQMDRQTEAHIESGYPVAQSKHINSTESA